MAKTSRHVTRWKSDTMLRLEAKADYLLIWRSLQSATRVRYLWSSHLWRPHCGICEHVGQRFCFVDKPHDQRVDATADRDLRPGQLCWR